MGLTPTEEHKSFSSDCDEEEEEDGSDEEFIKQLELLQSQDITSLQQLIVSMENQSSSS